MPAELVTVPSTVPPLAFCSLRRAVTGSGAEPPAASPSPSLAETLAGVPAAWTWSSTQSTEPPAGTEGIDVSVEEMPGWLLVYSDAPRGVPDLDQDRDLVAASSS